MSLPISKAALVKDLAESSGCNHGMAREFLDVLTKVVTRRLINGDAVMLPNLVKFEPRDRAARLVHNPRTGEMMHKDACKSVTARAHNAIKAAVNA